MQSTKDKTPKSNANKLQINSFNAKLLTTTSDVKSNTPVNQGGKV